jgi:hypothetical protein
MSMSKTRFNRLSVLLLAALGLLLGAALRSSAGTLFVDLRDVTTQGLTNRRVILTPLSTPAGGAGTVIVSDRISLLATNAFYVSNLVAGTYALELQAPPTLTRFQCTMPDTNGVVNLVSILTAGTNDTGTAAYAWTMSAADLRYPSLFGTGLSATEVNGRLQLTATGTTESVVPTNAISAWIAASNAPMATTNWVKLYVATNATAGAITNLQTLPMFTDGVQFTNPASGQRGRLELREFLGTPWLWFSNGVFESAYFSGNGSSLTALNADNIASGNLDVARLNGGSGASATTYWRGDGTWATPAGGSGGVATLNGSATNLTMRGDTTIYAGASAVVQVTADSPGELYGFGSWTLPAVTVTSISGDGSGLTGLPGQTNGYHVRGIVAGSGMTGSTNLTTGVVTLTSSGGGGAGLSNSVGVMQVSNLVAIGGANLFPAQSGTLTVSNSTPGHGILLSGADGFIGASGAINGNVTTNSSMNYGASTNTASQGTNFVADFGFPPVRTVVVTNTVSWTGESNAPAVGTVATVTYRLIGASTNNTVSFWNSTTNWTWFTVKPTTVDSNRVGLLTLTSWGIGGTNVTASWILSVY